MAGSSYGAGNGEVGGSSGGADFSGGDFSGGGMLGTNLSGTQMGSLFSAAGGLVGGVLGAVSDWKAADQYRTAADQATAEAGVAAAMSTVRQTMERRKINMTLGAQRAAQASAGFTESGSGLDLLRESTQQGNLSVQMLAMQGEQQQADYMTKATQEEAAAQSSDTGAVTSLLGGGLKAAGALVGGFA